MDAQTTQATTQTAATWIPILTGILGIALTIGQILIALYLRSIGQMKSEVKEMRAELNKSIEHINSRLENQFVTRNECLIKHEAFMAGIGYAKRKHNEIPS